MAGALVMCTQNGVVWVIGAALLASSSAMGGYSPTMLADGSQLLYNEAGVRTDDYGKAVAVDGDRIIVGEPGGDGANGNSGNADIYVWQDTTSRYVFEASLGALVPAGDCPGGSAFGFAVDIDGDYAVVGAPMAYGCGLVFVFHRTGSNWSLATVAGCELTGGELGYAVDLEGLVVSVGAPGQDSVETYQIIPGLNGMVLEFIESIGPQRRGGVIRFGHSLDCDESVLLVGAPLDWIGGVQCGSVNAYWRDSKTLITTHEATLGPDPAWRESGARFGESVAYSGYSSEAVGVVGIPIPEGDGSTLSGAAVFTRDGIPGDGDWTLSTTLIDPNTLAQDAVGSSVDVLRGHIVLGAPGAGPNGPQSGAAFLYLHSPSADIWVKQTRLSGYLSEAADSFGGAVALSLDSSVIVGARYLDESSGGETPDPGGVYVYRKSADQSWQFDTRDTVPCIPSTQTLENIGVPVGSDSFGSAVAVDGNTLLVGDPNGLDSIGRTTGTVRLFNRASSNAEWEEDTTDLFPNPWGLALGDRFGASVAIEGSLAVVGVPGQDFTSGKAWIYQYVSGSWVPYQQLTSTGPDDQLGTSVAITWFGGDAYIAVGAPGALSDQTAGGTVYVYQWDSTTQWATLRWTLTEDGFIGDTSAFGEAVAIDTRSDGTIVVAVGNPWYAPQAYGCVEIHSLFNLSGFYYSYMESRLVPSLETLDPWAIEQLGYAGSSVDLDGGRVIIGAPITIATRNRQGSAFVYESTELSTGLWEWSLEDCLLPAQPESYAFFGNSVDLLGDRAFVGTPSSNYIAENGGIIEMHQWDGTDWVYAMSYISTNTQPSDGVGRAIAVDSSTLLAGVPGYSSSYDTGERPHAVTFDISSVSPYIVSPWSTMSSDFAWPINPNGIGNVIFSNLLADFYYVPFDMESWLGSMSIVLDDVIFDLYGLTRTIYGSVDVAGPLDLKSASWGIAGGVLRVQDNVTIGSETEAGHLVFELYSILEVVDQLTMHENATLSMMLDINFPDITRLVTHTQAPQLDGGFRVLFGPNDQASDYQLGDRYALMSAGVPPVGGFFDVVVLPGLSDGLAFQLSYGPPDTRSQGGCAAGEIEDCFGNCCPDFWVGDGYCDDGSYLYGGVEIYLNCDSLECDGGDCTECWSDSPTWEMTIEVVSVSGLLDFGDPNSIAVSGDATAVEVVDLNGDGAEEICVTFAGAPGQLIIFENDGSGGVAQEIILATGDEPVDITSGDFDGDGRTDLAVANNLSQDVDIYYNEDNDLSTGFTMLVPSLNVNGPPMCLAGINANYDIYDDLVVGLDDIDSDGNGYWAIYTGAASLMPGGMGDGGGIEPSGIPLGADPANEEDQKDYVFVGRQDSGKTAVGKTTVLLTGVALTLDEYVTGADPGGIASGDLNGDGEPDLAVTSTTNGTVAILLQDPLALGNFASPILVPLGDQPTRITSIDFDGDGIQDLAAIAHEPDPISGVVEPIVRVLQGNSGLTFTSIDTANGEGVTLLDSGDISGDAVSELVTVGGGPAFRGRGLTPVLALRSTESPTCPGDFDGSGEVGIDDLLTLLSEFGSCTKNCQGDMDGDSDVDIDDMLELIGVWGPCPR